jgi:probable O-glycosylation ligase (exosortase A-associated)
MRDIAVIIMLVAGIMAAFRAPWLGVLALAVFTYLYPQGFAWGFAHSLPVYQILFIAFLLAFLSKGVQQRQPLPKDWRVPLFFFLWAYYLVTTMDAIFPTAAWAKFVEMAKIYLPLVFTLWLIDSREKLFYLIAAIAGSIALIAVKGGLFAIGTGFSYRVFGPRGTLFYENNGFAIVVLMTIPLLILLLREVTDRRIKLLLMGIIPLCFASALSSHSRGALVTMGVLVPLLLWNSKRKWLALPVVVLGAVLAVQNLPDHWFERMNTIQTYEEDASARGRLQAWEDGIEYALANPLTGSGFDGWRGVTYRDWHSAYVEMAAEHGLIAFAIWFSLIFGTMLSLTRLRARARGIPELRWVVNYSEMLRASLVAYAVGSLFLGMTYWNIIYHLIFIAVLVKQFALRDLEAYHARQGTGENPAGSTRGIGYSTY